ncbi:NAD-dependent epimerase/dehydratase family protein [Nocardioides sp. CER19]|uniref:NAD-dependent epimerase/dehydratase family protein n=1 Tax=Nocardioides sp. CER19 TaxID=3038538 RepID=UPI00244BE768|nr:NAD-dependent epimerase/dehydratase family protein [Nocardioides sp. CER19]MDH2412902.1 NAD-dependent epimerase/dehydratase family protein [Nocardioides sp. CER19]
MRILVLGGTVFLSHEIAAQAVARGHDVVCAARGSSGHAPDGARMVPWDRSEEPPGELTALEPDAVVDVARLPSYVRRAVHAFPDAHWSFVSTCNVYADEGTAGGTARSALKEPIDEDLDPASSPEAYGRMKVACERLVQRGARRAFIVRPGLIVGPHDTSGRFAYWPSHAAAAAADGGPLLVPGEPDDPVQAIDVRDLAAWILDAAEAGWTGAYDGNAAPITREAFLAALAEGVGADLDTRWVPTKRLVEAGVREWSGPGSLPLWIGEPGYEGFMARDVGASLTAGLAPRPLAETVRDTLDWLRDEPEAPVTGMSRAEELALLDRVAADEVS